VGVFVVAVGAKEGDRRHVAFLVEVAHPIDGHYLVEAVALRDLTDGVVAAVLEHFVISLIRRCHWTDQDFVD
jgi:hypothetical protein